MRCFQGRLFTVDGMVEDEAPLKKEIYEQVRYYATTSVARRIEHIMQAIKLACASEPPEIQTDRIHVRNGTYFADGHFTPEKEYCMNRLPIAYVSDAPAPTRWLQFLNELLYEEDIPALQEYKEKPVGRVDDPFLVDKMRIEKEGILLWALEGLHRLIRNNYQFTISERTAANLKEAMEQGNNILGFLKSEGYFEIRQGAKYKSTDFYKVYERWCLDNLEKPLAASTFIHHLKDNQKSLGIVYDDKCIGTNRGFHNVDVDLFLPVDVPSPWD